MPYFFLAKRASLSARAAFFSALAFALSPVGFYLSFAATTDGGAILFFTLALLPIMGGLTQNRAPNYIFVGLLIGCGALFKWTIYFLWPLILLGLFFFPLLRTKKIFLGLMLSLLGLLPSFYWNMTHEWATFKHVFSTLYSQGGGQKKGGNCLEYVAAQVAFFFPLFAAALPLAIKEVRKTKNAGMRFLTLFVAAAWLMVCVALNKKMQANWAFFLYPPCMILVGWVLAERVRWFWSAAILSFLAIGGSLFLPYVQSHSSFPLSYKINPYRQTMGVRELGVLFTKGGYDPREDFIFADKYQNSSLASFYGPGRKRAYFFNLGGARNNQFSYWSQMEALEKGKRGFFVVIENKGVGFLEKYESEYGEKLAPYFRSVEFVGSEELFSVRGEVVKHALLFRCEGYNGLSPTKSQLY